MHATIALFYDIIANKRITNLRH